MSDKGGFDYKEFREQWDILLETKKYKQCEKLCHDGLGLSPPDKDRGKLYNHLGYLYENFLEDKTFDDILEHYVLSLQVDESNSNSHFNLANFLLEQGMQHLLRARELNDKHVKANKKLAQLSPMQIGSSILLGQTRYRCVDIGDDSIRCVKIQKMYGSEEYEEVEDEAVELRMGTPDVPMSKTNNSKHLGNSSIQYSNDMNNDNNNHNNINNNSNNGRNPGSMNIDSSNMGGKNGNNDYYQLNSNNNNDNSNECGCGKPCILNVWIWSIIWFLAIVGIAAPIVGYFFMGDCENVNDYTKEYNGIDDGNLIIEFILDCNSGSGLSTFSQQLDSIDSMLNVFDNEGLTIEDYTFTQVCDNETYSSDWSNSTTTRIVSDLSDVFFTLMLQTCVENGQDSTNPVLCVIMVTDYPANYLTAIEYAAQSESLSDIYLTFVTFDELLYDGSIYAFLGSLSYKSRNEDVTWWNVTFDCNENSEIDDYCEHCLYYNGSSGNANEYYECNNEKMANLFIDGVKEKTETSESKEYCTIKMYFWYGMGGAAPLLICTLLLLLWLCNRCCCNKNRKNGNEMNNSNANGGNNSYNGDANTSSQAPLNSHHNHQGMQKETAYV